MNEQDIKCVMIIDENLPLGMIANTAAVLGVTLGKQFPETVGPDVFDKTGYCHIGITAIPIPILKGNAALIKGLREKLYLPEFSELLVVDFSDLAQGSHIYEAYADKLAHATEETLHYCGISICGNKKQVNKLTGSIPLLR